MVDLHLFSDLRHEKIPDARSDRRLLVNLVMLVVSATFGDAPLLIVTDHTSVENGNTRLSLNVDKGSRALPAMHDLQKTYFSTCPDTPTADFLRNKLFVLVKCKMEICKRNEMVSYTLKDLTNINSAPQEALKMPKTLVTKVGYLVKRLRESPDFPHCANDDFNGILNIMTSRRQMNNTVTFDPAVPTNPPAQDEEEDDSTPPNPLFAPGMNMNSQINAYDTCDTFATQDHHLRFSQDPNVILVSTGESDSSTEGNVRIKSSNESEIQVPASNEIKEDVRSSPVFVGSAARSMRGSEARRSRQSTPVFTAFSGSKIEKMMQRPYKLGEELMISGYVVAHSSRRSTDFELFVSDLPLQYLKTLHRDVNCLTLKFTDTRHLKKFLHTTSGRGVKERLDELVKKRHPREFQLVRSMRRGFSRECHFWQCRETLDELLED